jgi:hypothetical protein
MRNHPGLPALRTDVQATGSTGPRGKRPRAHRDRSRRGSAIVLWQAMAGKTCIRSPTRIPLTASRALLRAGSATQRYALTGAARCRTAMCAQSAQTSSHAAGRRRMLACSEAAAPQRIPHRHYVEPKAPSTHRGRCPTKCVDGRGERGMRSSASHSPRRRMRGTLLAARGASPVQWGCSVRLAEGAREVDGVSVADAAPDLGDCVVGFDEHLSCCGHASFDDPALDGSPGFSSDDGREVAGGESQLRGDVFERDWLAVVRFDVCEDFGEQWLVVDPEVFYDIAREPCHVDE